MSSVVALTQKLIEFDTVSAHSNAPCISFLEEKLKAIGFHTNAHLISNRQGVRKINLIARRGGDSGGLLLAGHSDTVPFRAEQKANLSAFQEGGLLYGRGSCDMKGAIAAQYLAAKSVADLPLKRPLTLAFTCDEEIGCLGAKAMLGTSLLQSDFAIVGEPTSLQPMRMHKGYVGLEVTLRGRAAHSSDPAKGRSAILAAVGAIQGLEAYADDLSTVGFEPDPQAFHPNCCTMNIGLIRGGVARNVIPEHCTFVVEFRPLPGQSPQVLLEAVRARVKDAVAPLGVESEVVAKTQDAAMHTPANAEVLAFLEALSGQKSSAIAFSTEGKEYNRMGMQTAIYGPGSIGKAHQEDEYVPLDELEASVDHYRAAILHFCS